MIGSINNNTNPYNTAAINNDAASAQSSSVQTQSQNTPAAVVSLSYEARTDNNVPYTYDKYEHSFLRNIQDNPDMASASGLRDSYYRTLFAASNETVNDMLDRGFYGIQVNGTNAYNLELSVSRYEELREEVNKAFGHDNELLAKNLKSLDKAFESNLNSITARSALSLEHKKLITENEYANNNNYKPHKLAANHDFNYKEFKSNALNMTKEFAKSYLEQVNSDSNYTDAFKNSMDFVNSMFSKTTSVNNLSFSDFMVLQKYLTSYDQSTTSDKNIPRHNALNIAFNDSTDLSEELRALLN